VGQQPSCLAWQQQVTDQAALEDPGATLLLVDVQGGPVVPAEYAASQPAPQFAGGALGCVRVQQSGHVVRVAPELTGPGGVKVVVGRGEEAGRVTDTVRVVAHGPEARCARRASAGRSGRRLAGRGVVPGVTERQVGAGRLGGCGGGTHLRSPLHEVDGEGVGSVGDYGTGRRTASVKRTVMESKRFDVDMTLSRVSITSRPAAGSRSSGVGVPL
jgi:hypothetical protein